MSNKKKDISAQNRHEDEVLSRTLLWIGGAAILIMLLLLVNRYYINYRTTEIMLAAQLGKTVLPVCSVVSLLLCLAGAALAFRACKQNRGAKWFVALSIFFGALAVSIAVIWRFQSVGVQIACAAVPAAAVLALVYYLFQREFFISALPSGIAILGLWLVRRAAARPALIYLFLVLAAAVLIAIVFFTRKVQAAGGLWKDKRVLSKNASYPMVYISAALSAVILVAAVAAGASVAYFLMFPVIGWLVIMAVYFTVKLM